MLNNTLFGQYVPHPEIIHKGFNPIWHSKWKNICTGNFKFGSELSTLKINVFRNAMYKVSIKQS